MQERQFQSGGGLCSERVVASVSVPVPEPVSLPVCDVGSWGRGWCRRDMRIRAGGVCAARERFSLLDLVFVSLDLLRIFVTWLYVDFFCFVRVRVCVSLLQADFCALCLSKCV